MAKKKAARRPTARNRGAAPRKRAGTSRSRHPTARSARRRSAGRAAGRAAKAKARARRIKKTPAGRRAAKAAVRKTDVRQTGTKKAGARKASAKVGTKAAAKRKAPEKVLRTKPPAKVAPPAPKAAAPTRRLPAKSARPQRGPAPGLNRERRTIADDDVISSPPSSFGFEPRASSARSGGRELHERFERHKGDSGPSITGGDVDADWDSAYTVGDEAPGGDNPTPDQDLVDEIGRAVGVQYEDDEELEGEHKIAERDRHRWEYDPASSDDWDDRDD